MGPRQCEAPPRGGAPSPPLNRRRDLSDGLTTTLDMLPGASRIRRLASAVTLQGGVGKRRVRHVPLAAVALGLILLLACSIARPASQAFAGAAGTSGGLAAAAAAAASPERLRGAVGPRRVEGAGAAAATLADVGWRQPQATPSGSRWDLWPALPIAPYERRVTMVREVVPGDLWLFEQKQGILYVHVPIRMTVYRMQTRRGLFVYAPVAPTAECVRMLRELEEQHGEVAYIVLPTVAVEHKYFVGPFARAFPRAEVWVCPGQFSVPLQLPLQFLGFPGDRLHTLPKSTEDAETALPEEWAKEGIDFRVLGPIGKDVVNGAFAEAAFYLRRLRTMLVTDLVVSVPDEVPEIIAEDPRALAFHARDASTSPVETSEEAMARGWRRISLFALFFQSSAIDAQTVQDAFRDAVSSEAKDLGWGGLLPWTFRKRWEASFRALRGPLGGGGLFVAPILSELILNRYLTSDVWPFVEDIARSWWDMERVIPAHFEAPVSTGAGQWRDAFRRAFGEPPGPFFGQFLPPFPFFGPLPGPRPLEADFEYLRNTSSFLTQAGVIEPPELPASRS